MKANRLCRYLLALSLMAPAIHAHNDPFADVDYTVTDLGGGIYRLEAAGGNIGLSVGEDGAFLIDAQYAPLAPELKAAIAGVTDKPVKFLLNTHWHGDHIGGNAAMAATGAIIMAHDNVRARMAAPGPKRASAEALPMVTYSDATTFHLNGQTIRAFHFSNAHTDGDTIVHFPDANIIHAGDILFNGLYPYIDLGSGGTIDGYIAAMELLVTMADDDTPIIAGHGPLGDKAAVQRSLDMLKDAKARVAKLIAEGLSREEILAADPLSDYHDDWAWRFITAERMTTTLFDGLSVDVNLTRVTDDPAMLDFWIGEWDLTWEGKDGPAKGTNTIRKVLNGAVIHESFNGNPGTDFLGESYSVLSRVDGSWKQVWVDSAKGYLDFDGYREGGSVVFHREGKDPAGNDILQRMVFRDIKANAFVWDWETSVDGKEWTLRWRINYQRKNDN